MTAFLRDYVNRTAAEDGPDRSQRADASRSDTPQRGGWSHNAFLPVTGRRHLLGYLEIGR
jgi:hypothetical protein